MSSIDKLTEKLLSRSKDFTWAELRKLLAYFSYKKIIPGRTSGSKIKFIHDKYPSISLHKSLLKNYQVNQVVVALKNSGCLP